MTDDAIQLAEPMRCPECSAIVVVRQLEVEDETGRESLLLIDCPRGDYSLTATQQDIISIATDVIMEQLRYR